MQIAILGPLEVRDTAGRPVEVGGARLRCLLTRLAVDAGRPVPVAALVDAVWGERPPADEANALQTLVSRLRRALGDPAVIAQSGAGYRLVVDADDVDAHRFARLAADGGAALRGGETRRAAGLLSDALELWRGPALADAPGDALVADAARLEDLRLAARVDRIEADLADGVPGLVPELEALAAAHPLHERLAGQLLRALGASGRQAEALQAYERLRARLADELGVDPSAELQEIHLALLRGEVSAAAAPPARRTNLKAQLTSFVGRDDEVARIGKALEQNRLVTLVGPGGAGKTRLAAEAAAGIVDGAPDGVWLVELASVTDGADVAQTVLGSLGVREAHLLDIRTAPLNPRDALGRLVESLADKDALLILDNCEHLVEASARVADVLLGAAPRLRVLTTSREPLAITGEVLIAVPPLGQPSPDATAAAAMEFPAVRLFADRAAAVRPDFAIDDGSVAGVIEIVRRLDGLPLAIELAAARLRSLPLTDIATRLSDRFRLLTGGSRTALPRHRTLRAVVEWSWELLSPAERVLAERLAVFPAGATEASAAAVCSDDQVSADELPDLLASLVEKSLLAPGGDGERLRMLETIREYGVERLAERAELGAIRSAHAHYFADLVDRADQHVRTRDQLPWMRLLDAERDNLLSALRHLVDIEERQRALDLACQLGWYWMFTGAQAEASTWLRFALTGAEDVHPDAVLLAETMATVTSDDESQLEGSAEGFARLPSMLARYRVADVERYPMLALMRPLVAMFAGDDGAMAEAVTSARQNPDPWIAASAEMLAANIAENNGELDDLRASAAAAQRAFEELGERWGWASCLQLVGMVQTIDGALDAAVDTYREALRLVAELGSHDDAAWLHLRLADVLVRQGELAAAAREAEQAHELCEASGSIREAIFGRVVTADVARRSGDVATGRRLLKEALDRIAAMPQTHPMAGHGLAVALGIAAKHELQDGDLVTGTAHLEAAYEKAIGTRDMPIVATVGGVSAQRALLIGEPVDAAERLGAAARLRGYPDHTHPDIAELTSRLRAELGDAEFEAAFERGRALGKDDAIARLSPSAG